MSVLETLEICFSADLSGVAGQLEDLGVRLKSLSAQSLQTAGMFSSAGAAMAENFARGLASGRGAVTAQGAATVSALAAALASGRTGAALEGASAAAGYASAVNGGVSGAKSAGRQLSAGLAAGIRSGKSGVTSVFPISLFTLSKSAYFRNYILYLLMKY